MNFKVCEYCGAHLDFGELCDCRKSINVLRGKYVKADVKESKSRAAKQKYSQGRRS